MKVQVDNLIIDTEDLFMVHLPEVLVQDKETVGYKFNFYFKRTNHNHVVYYHIRDYLPNWKEAIADVKQKALEKTKIDCESQFNHLIKHWAQQPDVPVQILPSDKLS